MNLELSTQRKRRSEKYNDPVIDIRTDKIRSESKTAVPADHVRRNAGFNAPDTSSQSVPFVMDRPGGTKSQRTKRKIRAEWKMPHIVSIVSLILFLILITVFASTQLMNAWLKKSFDSKDAAALAVVEKHPLMYRDLIELYAVEYNLQPSYVAAIIMNESSFRPMALSKSGARGLMQLMEDTAFWIAGKLHIDGYSFERMYDPESNIRFGCWYLNYLSDLFDGDPVCVTAAFHAGQGQVLTWLCDPILSPDGKHLDPSAMNDGPTKAYIGRVTEDYGIYRALYYD